MYIYIYSYKFAWLARFLMVKNSHKPDTFGFARHSRVGLTRFVPRLVRRIENTCLLKFVDLG